MTKSNYTGGIIFVIALSFIGFIYCDKRNADLEAEHRASTARSINADNLLKEQIDIFSSDIGPEGEQAWHEIKSRQDLLTSLSRLQQSAARKDFLRIQIAFVFCNLDQDYEKNKQIILSDVIGSSGKDDFSPEAAMMIKRLIERGDKTLLKPLFEASSESDGCLAESFQDIFVDEMENEPEVFLNLLKDEPLPTRKAVYDLIDVNLSEKTKKYLQGSVSDPTFGKVAKEMLKASRTHPSAE